MEGYIKIVLGEGGRITKQVVVCGVLPSTEPLPEPGEINLDVYGDDTAVSDFLIFFAKHFDEGAVINRELAPDTRVSE